MKKASRLLIFTIIFSILLGTVSFAQGELENAHVNTGDHVTDTIGVALSQIGYMETESGGSKYAQWYGVYGSWCAMFVSWCLRQAGVPKEVVPNFAYCPSAMVTFQSWDRWQDGPAYGGGEYTPKAGDLIFFDWYGTGSCYHTGIVLYVEDGYVYTVEGNTTARRMDVPEQYQDIRQMNQPDKYHIDRVIVRKYKTDSIYIRGYALPDYTTSGETDGLFDGVIDIEKGSVYEDEMALALKSGFMELTGEHTFEPFGGVTRGEYAALLTEFFGLEKYGRSTPEFSDLDKNHEHYDAVMTLRSYGILNGSGDNRCDPDTYIFAADAVSMLERLCYKLGLTCPDVDFDGNIRNGLLHRYELAHGLCAMMYKSGTALPMSESSFAGFSPSAVMVSPGKGYK